MLALFSFVWQLLAIFKIIVNDLLTFAKCSFSWQSLAQYFNIWHLFDKCCPNCHLFDKCLPNVEIFDKCLTTFCTNFIRFDKCWICCLIFDICLINVAPIFIGKCWPNAEKCYNCLTTFAQMFICLTNVNHILKSLTLFWRMLPTISFVLQVWANSFWRVNCPYSFWRVNCLCIVSDEWIAQVDPGVSRGGRGEGRGGGGGGRIRDFIDFY